MAAARRQPETFASYGPDKSGRLVRYGTPDGQHFTVAGEDLAASYLFPKIVEALDAAGIERNSPSLAASSSGASSAM